MGVHEGDRFHSDDFLTVLPWINGLIFAFPQLIRLHIMDVKPEYKKVVTCDCGPRLTCCPPGCTCVCKGPHCHCDACCSNMGFCCGKTGGSAVIIVYALYTLGVVWTMFTWSQYVFFLSLFSPGGLQSYAVGASLVNVLMSALVILLYFMATFNYLTSGMFEGVCVF